MLSPCADPPETFSTLTFKRIDRSPLYTSHFDSNSSRKIARIKQVTLLPVVYDKEKSDTTIAPTTDDGVVAQFMQIAQKSSDDRFIGDARLRTVRALLSRIDGKGWERSAHQVQFHESFIRACARIIYKEEWPVHRTAIMARNGWATSPSEIMVSTPRRFGKTFSVAMFCICMVLACGTEIVVFSPARRASRKILERMRE